MAKNDYPVIVYQILSYLYLERPAENGASFNNASFKLAQVEGDIKNWHTLIVDEIEVLGRLKEYSFEATEFYKKTLNLSEAIKYADGLVEMAEAKAKMEAQKAAEQPKPQENEQMEIPTQNFMPAPESPGNDSLELFEIGFRVRGTADQLQKLSHFLERPAENGASFNRGRAYMAASSKWFKNDKKDKIWWLDNASETKGEWIFSFDKKTEFNMFADYPAKLTAEQKQIFDEENPYWAEFFEGRT